MQINEMIYMPFSFISVFETASIILKDVYKKI